MIRVSLAQATHFSLHKNGLAGVKATNLGQLVDQVVGLPGEPAMTPFLAAFARLAHFEPDPLWVELDQSRRLIKSNLMRTASYIVPVERYVTLHAATTRQRNQDFNSEFRLWGLDNSEAAILEQAILEALAGQPATAAAITRRLAPAQVQELSQTGRSGRVTKTSNVALVLRWLVARGVLATSRAELDTNEAWRSESLLYAPLNYWYPSLDLTAAPGEAEAQAELAQAYLAAFGPASEADISFWTGFGKSETARAVGALTAQTTLALVEGIPGMLLLLKAQAEALQATQPPPAPIINVLPADDPFTTAHRASRTRFFSDQKLQRHVFSSTGAAKPSLLVNGQIVGIWEWLTENDPDLTWRLLSKVEPALLPLLQAEVERTRTFIHPNTYIR